MRYLLTLIVFLSFFSLYGQSQAPSTMTLEQALVQIEDRYEVAVIYNPREVKGTKRVTMVSDAMGAKQAVAQLLGPDYQVVQRGEILTIRYVPRPKEETPSKTIEKVAPADTVISVPVDTLLFTPVSTVISAPVDTLISVPVDTVLLTPVDTVISALVDTILPASTNTLPVAAKAPTSSPKKKKNQYSSSRLFINQTLGYGSIAHVGNVAATFDLTYAYFFHPNWGVSAGAGVDCYAKTAETTEQTRMTTAYFPISIQTDYLLTKRVGIIGSVGSSIQLPISGSYCVDSAGERYAGTSLLFGVRGDVGMSIVLIPQLSLGLSLYAQSIVASSGDIAPTLSGQYIYPWQVGLCLSLRVNRWKK